MTSATARRKGYCDATALIVAAIPASEKRREYLAKHVPGCETCEFANLALNIEEWCATAMGPEAVRRFARGEVQRFRPEIVTRYVGRGMALLPPEKRPRFVAWMGNVVQKHWLD